jgi:hypothetical protein
MTLSGILEVEAECGFENRRRDKGVLVPGRT